MKKLLGYVNNQKGSHYVSYIIVITVTTIIAINLLPKFNENAKIRSEKTISMFNSTDTISIVE